MGNIVAKFDIDKLFAGVYEAVDIITATVVDAMQMACLEVTQNAKLLNTYKDRTHLLRSSIGFVIYNHGEKVAESFGSTGGENDIVAVIVAAADYALYVESKGYDVISGPCSELNAILSKYIQIAIEELRA